MNRKLVHIGLDGLNPDLVQEWRAELPNLDGLMEEGMWGRMESTVPPITPQAWTCMMSGRNPGQFGFWNFTYRSEYSYGEPNLVNSGVVMGDSVLMARGGSIVGSTLGAHTGSLVRAPAGSILRAPGGPTVSTPLRHMEVLRCQMWWDIHYTLLHTVNFL